MILCPCVCLSVHVSVYLSVCLSIRVSIHLSVPSSSDDMSKAKHIEVVLSTLVPDLKQLLYVSPACTIVLMCLCVCAHLY